MNQNQINNLIAWGKEFGRVVLLGAVSYLLTAGVLTTLVSILFGVKLDTQIQVVIVGLLTSVLKGVDRQLHDSGVAEKGLTRF